jgi:hypothetical protein
MTIAGLRVAVRSLIDDPLAPAYGRREADRAAAGEPVLGDTPPSGV